MSGNEELPDRGEQLERQAVELIGAGTTAVEPVVGPDVSRYQYTDSYPDWRTSTPSAPMFRVILLRELAGCSDPELHRRQPTQNWLLR